ncbi:MAG: shikimate dehydrogenase [Anaerolineales bacterium]|nr:shikimate dehydrogenase [Anaerolineales bacterium]
MTDKTTFNLGLIGWPLGHTLSPLIHRAALSSAGLTGDYQAYPISPEDDFSLNEIISKMRVGQIDGLNITIPHKQRIFPFLDTVGETARAIGAVNTICLKDGKLIGENTDAPGFLKDLKRWFSYSSPGKALVLGAGGGARAVVYALSCEGWQVTIAARRSDQAEALCESLKKATGKLIDSKTLSSNNLEGISPDLLVNTTPIGMYPNENSTPWPEEIPFPNDTFIYDLVYNPQSTKLILDATNSGLKGITGLGMLIEQARLSFEHWTGILPDYEIMNQAIIKNKKKRIE